MAEALYYLSESLAWAPTSAPRGELVLISDTVESSGSFLVQHFVALFLKAGTCLRQYSLQVSEMATHREVYRQHNSDWHCQSAGDGCVVESVSACSVSNDYGCAWYCRPPRVLSELCQLERALRCGWSETRTFVCADISALCTMRRLGVIAFAVCCGHRV